MGMRLTTSSFVVLAALALPSHALAQFSGPPDSVAEELNSAAKTMDVPARFATGSCSEEVRRVCRVTGPSVLGTAMGDIDGPADGLLLIFDGENGDPMELIIAVGVVIAALSPDLTAEERGETTISMLQPVLKGGQTEAKRQIDGVTYTFAASPVIGVTFSADASD